MPAGFFRYAADYLSASLTVFADDDQAVTESHSTLEQIRDQGRLPKPHVLSTNHRNTAEIAAAAEHFHQGGRVPTLLVRRGRSGSVPRLVQLNNAAEIARFIGRWWRNRGGRAGVVGTRLPLLQEIQSELIRQNVQPSPIVYSLERKNEDRLDFFNPGITLMTEQAVKGQEFDDLFVIDLAGFGDWRIGRARRTLYMVCSRARERLIVVAGPNALTTAQLNDLPAQNVLIR